MYKATCVWRNDQHSTSIFVAAPSLKAFFSDSLTSIISWSLMVKSSSLVPAPPGASTATDGRIGVGGTSKAFNTRFSGRPITGSSHKSSQSSSVIPQKTSLTSAGDNIDAGALDAFGFISLFCAAETPSVARKSAFFSAAAFSECAKACAVT